MMVNSPVVSAVEGSSTAYAQCDVYRRLVALIKGPQGRTFAVDIFRVRGGEHHAYRLFSELAASDAPDGEVLFHNIEMPPERPLPIDACLPPSRPRFPAAVHRPSQQRNARPRHIPTRPGLYPPRA